MADRRKAALVVVHHTSKSPRADPVDEISGTLGLTGAFDTILVLKRERQQNEATPFFTESMAAFPDVNACKRK